MDLQYVPAPRFTRAALRNGWLARPTALIDIGVQGGIAPRWEHFGDQLDVHGFDPLEEAIAPLRALGKARHAYHALALGDEDGERDLLVAAEPTASSFYAHAASAYAVDQRVQTTSSRRKVPIRRLDSLKAAGVIGRADFVKLDCEGFEPEVLKGAQSLLKNEVLGLEVETNFNTSASLPQSHFGAVSELLLPHGFTLYDLAFNRVPRASFMRRAQALGILHPQTQARPATLNVLYFRDLSTLPRAVEAEDVLRAAAILEIYGMADSAYDLLAQHRSVLPDEIWQLADLLIVSRLRSLAARARNIPQRLLRRLRF
jgi:FkbM family methyltransferase